MHNAAIAALGLHFVYIPYSVRPEDIGPAINSIRTLGIVGANLTIPHKECALPFLDEVSPEAQAVGAVNTIHNVDGRLIGYNTDGDGFLQPLLDAGFTPQGKSVVVLGAGGAARSVAFRLAWDGACVSIVNRTAERARLLAAAAGVESTPWPDDDQQRRSSLINSGGMGWSDLLEQTDLLVNTTPIGMYPNEDSCPIPAEALRPGLFIYDLVYNPPETHLIQAARAAKAPALNGVQMLVGQGAKAFEIWTGIAPPRDIMERAVMDGLSARL